MNNTNLELSKNEFALIANSDFILTKNRIIEKIIVLFGALSETYKNKIGEYAIYLPNEVLVHAPKIYKGEQYKKLPYVMLDYPRAFSKTSVFAIRSFFWWGNYFSISLHVSGKYTEWLRNAPLQSIHKLQNNNWYICVNEADEWQHHFEKDNYVLADEMNEKTLSDYMNRRFIKIAKKLPLKNWKEATLFYEEQYKELLAMLLVINYPSGETVL